MAKRALVFIAPGFEEVEFVTPVDILRRGEVEVTIASLQDDKTAVVGRNGMKIEPDCTAGELGDALYDLVFLPGGLNAAKAFAGSDTVEGVFKRHNEGSKLVAAICASPAVAFSGWRFNEGRSLTCYPALAIQLNGNYKYSTETVVVDGNMVTSQGPGTAFAFGMKLLELLNGEKARDKISSDMLYGS